MIHGERTGLVMLSYHCLLFGNKEAAKESLMITKGRRLPSEKSYAWRSLSCDIAFYGLCASGESVGHALGRNA